MYGGIRYWILSPFDDAQDRLIAPGVPFIKLGYTPPWRGFISLRQCSGQANRTGGAYMWRVPQIYPQDMGVKGLLIEWAFFIWCNEISTGVINSSMCSAIIACMPGIKCPKILRVILGFEWPRRREMAKIGTPWLSIIDAEVCLRSWKRISGRQVAIISDLNYRSRLRWSIGVPQDYNINNWFSQTDNFLFDVIGL